MNYIEYLNYLVTSKVNDYFYDFQKKIYWLLKKNNNKWRRNEKNSQIFKEDFKKKENLKISNWWIKKSKFM